MNWWDQRFRELPARYVNLGISADSHSSEDTGNSTVASTKSETKGAVISFGFQRRLARHQSAACRGDQFAASAQASSSSAQHLRGGIAISRVFLEAAEHDRFEIRGYAGLKLRGWSDRVSGMSDHHFHGGLAHERRAARECVVGDGAQAVDIGRSIGWLVMHDLLGGHVQRRAGDGPFLRDMNRLVFAQGL